MNVVVAVDLDGTIVDARVRQVELALAILNELGAQPADPDALWGLKREGAGTADALLALGIAPEVAAETQRRWVERVEQRDWLARDALLDGAVTALDAMRADGALPFVLTARRDAAAAAWQVERLGLGLDVEVVDPADAAAGKTAALRRRSAAGMIGDAESDAAAAAAAEIPFVAVSGGQRSAAFLRAAGVELLAEDLAAAWELLREGLR